MIVTLEGRNWIYQNLWEAGQTHNPQVGQPNFKRPCPPVRVIQSSRHIIDSPSSWDLASRAFWRAHVTSDLLTARVHHRVTVQAEATLPLKSLKSVMKINAAFIRNKLCESTEFLVWYLGWYHPIKHASWYSVISLYLLLALLHGMNAKAPSWCQPTKTPEFSLCRWLYRSRQVREHQRDKVTWPWGHLSMVASS